MVMKMQNLDFTAIHIPGKSNMTDYLSRHPLPEVEKTGHERHVRAVIETDHAVVMETIQSATKDDKAKAEESTRNREVDQKRSRLKTILRPESGNLCV